MEEYPPPTATQAPPVAPSPPPPTRREKRRGPGYRGGCCGCGCGGFLLVLTLGIFLSLFNAVLGLGISFRVPFTPANVTAAAAIGAKEKAPGALPPYTHGMLASNEEFINHSQTMTVWPAEGVAVTIVGRQDGAPAIDIYFVAR